MFRECTAFIKKDFLTMRSYRAQFVTRWMRILISLLICFFASKLVKNNSVSYLCEYGGEYFPFLLVGIIFLNYTAATVGGFVANISGEQLTGTLEFLFVAPLKTTTMLLSMSFWHLFNAAINVAAYLLFATLLFGVRFTNANIFAVAIVLFLAVICFSSIGIIYASSIIVFKREVPFNAILGGISAFFGGVFFPVTILPQWLQVASYFFPITYFLRVFRYALIRGAPFGFMINDIIMLTLFSFILLPASIFCFKSAVAIAKRNASLSFY